MNQITVLFIIGVVSQFLGVVFLIVGEIDHGIFLTAQAAAMYALGAALRR